MLGAGRTGFSGPGNSFLSPLELLVASRVVFEKTEGDRYRR